MESPQDIHRLIAIPIKREMQGAEGAGVVELGEIDLVGEAGGAPVALLGGVPAMARVATKRNKQQISLAESRLQVWRDLFIECSAECKNNWMMLFKQIVQNLFFEWGVKAADNDLISLTYELCPLVSELGIVWRHLAGGEECHKWSIQKLCISG